MALLNASDLLVGTASTTVTSTTYVPGWQDPGGLYGIGGGIAQTFVQGPSFYLRNPTMHQVKTHPAFQAPISELVDLWRVKYGSHWVTAEEILREDFYEMAAQRLKATGHLECHTIIEPSRHDVYKLVE